MNKSLLDNRFKWFWASKNGSFHRYDSSCFSENDDPYVMRALWIIILALWAGWCFTTSNPRPETVPLLVTHKHEPVPEPPAPQSVKILRKMKLPVPEKWVNAVHLFNTDAEFRNWLGPKNQNYVKWNNVDFTRQSVVIVERVNPVLGLDVKINSVYIKVNCVVVEVVETHNPGTVYPAALEQIALGVVIPKNVGPVERDYRVHDSKLAGSL